MVMSNWVSEVVMVINTPGTVLSFTISFEAVFGHTNIPNERNIVNTGLRGCSHVNNFLYL